MSNSKTKQKDKKSDLQVLEIEKRYEEAMSELLDKDLKLKIAEQNASRLGTELYEAKTQCKKLRSYIKEEFQKLSLTNENLRGRLTQLTSSKNDLELNVATSKAKLDYERKQNEDWKKEKERELDEARRHYATEIGRYQVQATDYAVSINERQALLAERTHLMETIQKQREDFKQKLADRDRSKIQAMDLLKKSLKDRVKQMKQELLSIRRDQLDNNTRLTLIQNHQLVQELEYQSVNTEIIIDKNVQLEKRIKQLENEVEIKAQIEQQIVKRSLISKKVLKTFQQKAEDLQKEKEQIENDKDQHAQIIEEKQKLTDSVTELSRALDAALKKINSVEKDLIVKNSQLEVATKKDKQNQSKGSTIMELLLKYYHDFMTQDTVFDGQNEIDLSKLKKKGFKQWQTWEVQTVVESILDKIKNNLTSEHLELDAWRKVADSRVGKLVASNKQNFIQEEVNKPEKCDSAKIKSLSLEKNKLFYQNKRRLSATKHRSLTKTSPQNSISFGKFVQANLREWGQSVKVESEKSLVDRFMKPNIKLKLKK